ncbi:MAG: gamma-glutamyltransferase [Alphaproteobacteria bacterium]|nr:gamma-glutamyltransferase [Alphaproteobacteria bacterium]
MMLLTRRIAVAAFALYALAFSPAHAQRGIAFEQLPPVRPVAARNGMVVTQEARASRIGVEVLRRGGNAVDAAVAVGFAMAVTYPRAGNVGGGGFMVIHLARGNRQVAIDYRERAPARTTRDTYLDERGEADPRKTRETGLAVGVPGTVAGLALAHRKYGSGKFRLADLIAPAIAMARHGIPVEDDTADSLPYVRDKFVRWPASAKIFLRRDGKVLQPGDRLIQRDLAATLGAVARHGPRGFYEGAVAEKIAAAVQAAGGLMTADDLKNYRPVERDVVRGRYRGYDIVSMAPPSSGGVLLIQMLNMLEGYKLRAGDPATLHLMIEVMKRAYADRAQFLGDPDFSTIPAAELMSKRYAEARREGIDRERAQPARDVRPGEPARFGGDNTTHYSVVDRFGNAVSNTYTINSSYGLGLVAEGTGVLLNDELDDFAAKPGAPNAFGLIGLNEANAPGPDKRPLSSMTPTVVLRDGRPVLITGSPGGSRIITVVLQIVLNVIDHRMSVDRAVHAPRIHHQWVPDETIVEASLPAAAVKALEARGHRVSRRPLTTSANSIMVTRQGLIGAADSRTRGALAAGY